MKSATAQRVPTLPTPTTLAERSLCQIAGPCADYSQAPPERQPNPRNVIVPK